MDDILRVEGLTVTYRDRERTARAADGVSFALRRGRTLALVGESGCGKTTVGLSILNLVQPPGTIASGRVIFGERDVLQLQGEELRQVRGAAISMIFQDATSGLNPVLTVGSQVEEMVRAHREVSKRVSRAMAMEALRRQGLPNPESMMDAYPFQLSGGMCQRVMIAIATVLQPNVIIADEPTSALDVTVQAGILHELERLRLELDAAILLITHDLGVVARMADDVAVMYAGRIVERGGAADLFERPQHPYTAALLAARPRLDGGGGPLTPIRGAPPDLSELDGRCAFLPRCPKAISQCRTAPWPPLRQRGDGHDAACFNPMFSAEAVG